VGRRRRWWARTSFLGSEHAHGGQTGNEEPGQAQRVFEQPEPARCATLGTHSGTATVAVFGWFRSVQVVLVFGSESRTLTGMRNILLCSDL
jgi:hypothetical protein